MIKALKVILLVALILGAAFVGNAVATKYINLVGAQGNGLVKFSSVSTSTSVSVATTTGTLLLSANPNRVYARFMNNGGSAIYLNLGGTSTVAALKGVRLDNLGVYEINQNNLYTGQISAIASSTVGVGTLLIIEK